MSNGTNSSGATVSDISTTDVSHGVFSKTKVSSLRSGSYIGFPTLSNGTPASSLR